VVDDQDKSRPAGGYATQRGINYQNRVAAYFAACCLTERVALPGISASPLKSIRCETGEPLADILLTFEDESLAFVEVKRAMEFGAARMKPFVSHLVEQYLASKHGTSGGRFPWRRPLNPARDRLYLVTSSEAPARLTQHLSACLVRVHPESDPEELSSLPLNDAERDAFESLLGILREVWKTILGEQPNGSQIVELLSLFRIAVLDVNEGEVGEQNAQGFLKETVLVHSFDAQRCWVTLVQLMGRASETRMFVSREELRRGLRGTNLSLASTPSFRNDINALQKYTNLTLDSLDHLATLVVNQREIRIERQVTKYLREEAETQSLVVIGDPGAGKSGVLHELATALHGEGRDVVFLAADRLDDSLRSELGLDYELAEVLENWSGESTGLLFIDALDAARGSNALQVLRDLISRVAMMEGSRWRVVASIRIFDLRYSQELQRVFRRGLGEPGPQDFQDSSFPFVRHIKIPRFSPDELREIRTQSAELDAVFRTASHQLLGLLDIPFNLRLVAELLSETEAATDFRGIDTQVGLLDKYWLNRVIRSGIEGNIREAILTEIVNALVGQRKLTVAKLHILETAKEAQFSSLCSDNVIVEQVANLHGRNIIGFSHHLLFDYAVSRLILGSDFSGFLKAIARERDLSLFLRPSIDLFFKEAWLKHRDTFWTDLMLFSADEGAPALAKIIGPAVIPELATSENDLSPIVNLLTSADPKNSAIAEQWIVHVVGAVLAGVPTSSMELWSDFCLQITQANPSLRIAAVCQSLIDHILTQGQSGVVNSRKGQIALSRSAVYLLNAFASGKQREGWIVGRCILNVMDLFGAAPADSEVAIRRLITPEEIREHGAQQGHWLARKISNLFDIAPKLAADIFTGFFAYNERSEEKTSMGGGRILAMTSNRRQDYQQAHWQLSQHFSEFLNSHFELCRPIIVTAASNVIESEHKPSSAENAITYNVEGIERSVSVDYSAIWDCSGPRGEALEMADAYFRKLEELARAPSSVQLARDTTAAFLKDAQYAYFLRKVLIVAERTGPALADVVYPLLSSPTAVCSYDLSSLIGNALRTNYSALDQSRREQIESNILNLTTGVEGDHLEAMTHVRDRLLGCIPIDQVALPLSVGRIEELSERGGAPENRPPYVSSGFSVSPYSADDRLRERGVPIDEAPNAALRETSKRLWAFAGQFNNGTPTDADVENIEADIDEVWKVLSSGAADIHEDVANSAEAELLAACAAIAKVKSLDCSSALGMKVRTILFWGLGSTQPCYEPEYDKQWDDSPSGWGAPVQRIEAAEGIGSLLSHGSCVDEALLERVRLAISDLVPAVRFQTIVRLLPLYNKHIDALWEILTSLVRTERRAGVLAGAFYAVINPLAGRYKSEVVELIRELFRRTDLAGDGGEAFEWCHRIATGLYIYQGDIGAFELIRPILEGETFHPSYAGQCLRDIRGALTFVSDVPKATDAAVRKRAFGVIELIIETVSGRMNHMIHEIDVETRDEVWQRNFQELARLIDHISSQLYFSSGAYDGTNSHSKLEDEARRLFWHESQKVILALSEVAIPSAAHHLIETLQSFIPFEPIPVFHAIAAVVRSAKSWGYQYESLAVDLLVKVTENYIAEYRIELQKDLQSREELIDILETFVEAGWPSARRLSYRLEEIFR